MIAIQVAMQAVIVLRRVFEEQRCRAHLARLMAALEKRCVPRRKAFFFSHAFMPLVSNRHEVRIGGRAQRLNKRGQRVTEYLYSPRPKPCRAMTTWLRKPSS